MMNLSQLFFIVLLFTAASSDGEPQNCTLLQHLLINKTSTPPPTSEDESGRSSTNGVVNTHILTLFYYENNQVYIYNPMSNQDLYKEEPEKWIFYYIPVMLPIKQNMEYNEQWIESVEDEIRVKLMLGNPEIEELARQAIAKKYKQEISENYSQYWDVAPLMIDSLTAYIVRSDSSPVFGVQPYRAIHPNSLTITLKFPSSHGKEKELIVQNIVAGNYDIEISLYFAEFKQVSTNFVSITADQLKSVLSKTAADGGNTKAQYIHRSQVSKFVGHYTTNVKKMIYMEDSNVDASALTAGLEDQFISLVKQGMDNSQKAVLDLKFYDQIWSSSDLNPDRLTSEINKLFVKNESETQRHNDTKTYFSIDKDYFKALADQFSSSVSGSADMSGFGGLIQGSASLSAGVSISSSGTWADHLSQTNKDSYSSSELEHLFTQQDADVEWTGEKFIPKSFDVYKLTDLTDRLQVAVISKQLIADKKNGAIIRSVSALNIPVLRNFTSITTTESTSTTTTPTPTIFLPTGTIQMYASSMEPPAPWLFCNGSNISRVEYNRLFSVIGETYGAGDGNSTFNLPDFRGRVPVGLDESNEIFHEVSRLGSVGGQAMHNLTIDQLPSHTHGPGSLATSPDGTHTHSIYDPGHNHGGQTGSASYGDGGPWGMKNDGRGSDQKIHTHTIYTGQTGISIANSGLHSHKITNGTTESTGFGQSFSLMQPYQTINYIIYTA